MTTTISQEQPDREHILLRVDELQRGELEEVAFGQVRVVAPVEVLQVFALGQSRPEWDERSSRTYLVRTPITPICYRRNPGSPSTS